MRSIAALVLTSLAGACAATWPADALILEVRPDELRVVRTDAEGRATIGVASMHRLDEQAAALPLPNLRNPADWWNPLPGPTIRELRAPDELGLDVLLNVLGLVCARDIDGWWLCTSDGRRRVHLGFPWDNGGSVSAARFRRTLRGEDVDRMVHAELVVPLPAPKGTHYRFASPDQPVVLPLHRTVLDPTVEYACLEDALAAIPAAERGGLSVGLEPRDGAVYAMLVDRLCSLRDAGFSFSSIAWMSQARLGPFVELRLCDPLSEVEEVVDEGDASDRAEGK